MLSTILLSIAPALAPAYAVPSSPIICIQDDVEQRIAAAGDNIEALMALAQTFKDAEDDASARVVYEKVLTLDANHEEAHKALRHQNYDGQWFTSYAALSKYRRAEKKRMKDKGLIRYNNEWVDEKIVPYLRMGWELNEAGKYVSPTLVERAKEAAIAESKGFQFRTEDSSWVDPADFSKWEAGRYLIGDAWVSADEAQEYHSQIGQSWKYAGQHFVSHSTCDNDANRYVAWWADNTYPDLVRLFGKEPTEKPALAVFNSLEQFNQFAAGDQALQLQAGETGGYSSAHYAFYADIWFDVSGLAEGGVPEYLGGGAAYYNAASESEAAWGEYSVRHAAGISYAESIDRAWNTISEVLTNQGGGGTGFDAIWEEKSIPRWMLYGAGTYVERWGKSQNPDNPWGVRSWAMSEMASKGGLDPLETFLPFALDINDLDQCSRLIMGAGGVVSFILEGECKPVIEKHEAFKTALKSGASTKQAIADLEAALVENEAALRKFLNL